MRIGRQRAESTPAQPGLSPLLSRTRYNSDDEGQIMRPDELSVDQRIEKVGTGIVTTKTFTIYALGAYLRSVVGQPNPPQPYELIPDEGWMVVYDGRRYESESLVDCGIVPDSNGYWHTGYFTRTAPELPDTQE